jgi:glycosyltransferase involved in cell wall biosynthesis
VKYWLLTTEYPPFFGGGISTYCYNTARMFAARGHEVTVFVNDAAVSKTEITGDQGVRVVRFSTSRSGASAFLGHVTNISYEFAFVIKEFIEKEGKPALIEAQEYLGIAYYLLQFKYLQYDWCAGVPVVITMHSPSFLYMEYNHVPMYRYPNYWICEMERFCLQAADFLISPSQFMLTELGKRFELHNSRIAIIPNPVSAKEMKIGQAGGAVQDEIVFYGKLTVQKGAFKLLNYFQQLWDEGFERPLYLLGGQDIVYHPEGKTMGDIIRKRYKTYIEKGLLRLEDRIPPAKIGERLARAEVVIIPSANDNLPYVVFEMMALGKILLVSKQGGQSEVIGEGSEGLIFDHEAPQTFFSQLKKVLALPATERERISQNAIRKVEDVYGFEAVYQRKIATFNELLQQEHKPKEFPFIRKIGFRPGHAEPSGSVAGLLSIVVPYYNMGEFIDETMASLGEVAFDPVEIVVVNDGSTDEDSLRKLDGLRSRKGVRVIDTPNRGLAHARNHGAREARGEFLAFLDADDKVDPSYYPKALKVLKAFRNVHFVGAWTKYFGGSQKTWPTFNPEPPIILCHNIVNSSALVYKRSAFLEAGRNDPAMVFQGLEDYDSVISLVSRGYRGVVLPETLFHYRVRSRSMIRDISKSKKLFLYQHISKKNEEIYSTFAGEIFNLLNANGPGVALDNPTLDYHLGDRLPFGNKLSGRLIALIKKNRYLKLFAYKVYRLINR